MAALASSAEAAEAATTRRRTEALSRAAAAMALLERGRHFLLDLGDTMDPCLDLFVHYYSDGRSSACTICWGGGRLKNE